MYLALCLLFSFFEAQTLKCKMTKQIKIKLYFQSEFGSPSVYLIILIIKTMNMKSKALSRSLTALQDHFPTFIHSHQQTNQSLFDYLQTITSHLLPSNNIKNVIDKMKGASDAQQYRIQRNIMDIQSQKSINFIEQICYEANSTAIIAERQIYNFRDKELDGSSIVDDIWWNAQKKIEEIQYFMD